MENESTLIVKRVVDADPETLFEALTDQQIMQEWFIPSREEGWSATVQNEAEVGGEFKVDMHSPKETYWHKGTYREIVPNKKIVFTWNSHAVTDTLVTITLKKVKGGTEVKLVHEFMPNEEMKKNHAEGWTEILQNLDRVVTAKSS